MLSILSRQSSGHIPSFAPAAPSIRWTTIGKAVGIVAVITTIFLMAVYIKILLLGITLGAGGLLAWQWTTHLKKPSQ